MPYSREYNEEKYTPIKKHLIQLRELEEGKVLSILYNSPEEAEKARWLFYEYFHLVHRSKEYKLSLFINILLIGKKQQTTLSDIISTKKPGGITKKLEAIIQELLMLPNPRTKIAELTLDESISLTALAIILGELGRVLGE